MLWRVQFTVSALFLLLTSACGVYVTDSTDEIPVSLPLQPLTAPDDLLGSWKHCTLDLENRVSGAIYTFSANGSLTFASVFHTVPGCLDPGVITMKMKGSYVVDYGNVLDMTIGVYGNKGTSTLYRVYAVKGDSLMISNNAGVGGDKNNRDLELNKQALILTRVTD